MSGNRRSFIHVGQTDRDRVAGSQAPRVGHLHRQAERRSCLEVELARIGDGDDPRSTDREGTQAVATRDAERLGIAGIHVAGLHRTNRGPVRGVLRDREALSGNRRSMIDGRVHGDQHVFGDTRQTVGVRGNDLQRKRASTSHLGRIIDRDVSGVVNRERPCAGTVTTHD